MSDSNELWQAVTELRDRHSQLESRMSAHDARHEMFLAEFRESRRERQHQMESIAASLNTRLSQFDEKMDDIRDAKISPEPWGSGKLAREGCSVVLRQPVERLRSRWQTLLI